MPVLQPSEYDASYFEGSTQTYTHNAGYGEYHRMQYNRVAAGFGFTAEESTGNVFGDLAKGLNIKLNGRYVGKTVLVLGYAYGYEVKAFRDLGILADGIDVSPFAISQAEASIQQYLQVQDARTYLPTLGRNAYDYIFSRWFLECMSDADLIDLIPEMNRVCKQDQAHIMSTNSRKATDTIKGYNIKTLDEWELLPFERGSVLVVNDDFNDVRIK